jgi:hypothetical protein
MAFSEIGVDTVADVQIVEEKCLYGASHAGTVR